ncbi:MAG: hypothetical protein M3Q81_01635 [bacterium]|nr:hypothetical protein [bacterium]
MIRNRSYGIGCGLLVLAAIVAAVIILIGNQPARQVVQNPTATSVTRTNANVVASATPRPATSTPQPTQVAVRRTVENTVLVAQAATALPSLGQVQPVATLVPVNVAPALTGRMVTVPQVFRGAQPFTINGETWTLPLESWKAHWTSNGRWQALEPAPSGPDLGYCRDQETAGATQQTVQSDCFTHLSLVRIVADQEVLECIRAVSDIEFRIHVWNECSYPVSFQIGWRYNRSTYHPDNTGDQPYTESRPESTMSNEYNVVASQGDLGLFVANYAPNQPRSQLQLVAGTQMTSAIDFQYSCWDCLAHTEGPAEPQPIFLNDQEISHFGTPTAPLGTSELPGVVFPIPRQWDYQLRLAITIPGYSADQNNGTTIWLGRYDHTPRVVASMTQQAPLMNLVIGSN